MSLVVNDVLEKITDSFFSGEKFKIVALKNINGNVHATIVNIKDDSSKITIALSVVFFTLCAFSAPTLFWGGGRNETIIKFVDGLTRQQT